MQYDVRGRNPFLYEVGLGWTGLLYDIIAKAQIAEFSTHAELRNINKSYM